MFRRFTLSHDLGDEHLQLAILGEGNTSAKTDDETFVVKASSSCLQILGEDDVGACRFDKLLPMHDLDDLSDQDIEVYVFSGCQLVFSRDGISCRQFRMDPSSASRDYSGRRRREAEVAAQSKQIALLNKQLGQLARLDAQARKTKRQAAPFRRSKKNTAPPTPTQQTPLRPPNIRDANRTISRVCGSGRSASSRVTTTSS